MAVKRLCRSRDATPALLVDRAELPLQFDDLFPDASQKFLVGGPARHLPLAQDLHFSTRSFACGMARKSTVFRRRWKADLAQWTVWNWQPTAAFLQPERRQDQGGDQHRNSHGRDAEKYPGHVSQHVPDPYERRAIEHSQNRGRLHRVQAASQSLQRAAPSSPAKAPTSWIDYALSKQAAGIGDAYPPEGGSTNLSVANNRQHQHGDAAIPSACACPMHDISRDVRRNNWSSCGASTVRIKPPASAAVYPCEITTFD